MGNCQAAGDVIGATIQLPNGKVERLVWSVAARQVMVQHPGYYVALVPSQITRLNPAPEVYVPSSAQLKLLPPNGMLQLGQNYKLVSFEEVISDLSERKVFGGRITTSASKSSLRRVHSDSFSSKGEDTENIAPNDREGRSPDEPLFQKRFEPMRSFGRSGQWRPALQSIAEVGR